MIGSISFFEIYISKNDPAVKNGLGNGGVINVSSYALSFELYSKFRLTQAEYVTLSGPAGPAGPAGPVSPLLQLIHFNNQYRCSGQKESDIFHLKIFNM